MKPLELRKRLLVAESELNRDQLIQEWVVMTMVVRKLTGHVKSFGSVASTAALVVAGIAVLRRGKVGGADVHPLMLRTLLKGAGLVSMIWRRFRAKTTPHEN